MWRICETIRFVAINIALIVASIATVVANYVSDNCRLLTKFVATSLLNDSAAHTVRSNGFAVCYAAHIVRSNKIAATGSLFAVLLT